MRLETARFGLLLTLYVIKRCTLLELIRDMRSINANFSFNQDQDNEIKPKAMMWKAGPLGSNS